MVYIVDATGVRERYEKWNGVERGGKMDEASDV
jgi:hypothetical protein